LRGPEQFEAVFAHGTLAQRGLVIVRSRPNGLGRPRLGIVASRKALRRAVDRNRCKRVLREAFRAVAAALPALDIVVQLRDQGPQQRALTWAEAKNLFTALMK
jgi:ribonuclease P protein component